MPPHGGAAMNQPHEQFLIDAQALMQWRATLVDADKALDEAQECLGALCRRINLSDESDDLTEMSMRITTLLRQCQAIAAEVDEITTYERAHSLVSMMQGVLI